MILRFLRVAAVAFRKIVVSTGATETLANTSPTITSGSGVPTASEPKGSIYLRTGGSSAATVMYVATDSAGTWTALANTAVALQVAVAAGQSFVLDLLLAATGEALIKLADNLAVAAAFREGANAYLTFVTTNAAERVNVGKILGVAAPTVVPMADAAHALVYGTAGAGETKLTSNIALVDPDSGQASEILTLPPVATSIGVQLVIVNTGGEGIVVKDVAAATIITLDTAQHGLVVCDGTNWFGFMGGVT
jgi:hypothetical protein